MPWLFKAPETIVPELVQSEEEAPASTGSHCSWCGDEPDEYGSHSICAMHTALLFAQSTERKEKRTRA